MVGEEERDEKEPIWSTYTRSFLTCDKASKERDQKRYKRQEVPVVGLCALRAVGVYAGVYYKGGRKQQNCRKILNWQRYIIR